MPLTLKRRVRISYLKPLLRFKMPFLKVFSSKLFQEISSQQQYHISCTLSKYKIMLYSFPKRDSTMAQWVKNLPVMQETQVWSLGWEDPLEEGMATHSSILAWRIPWTEEPGRLQSMGWYDWSDWACTSSPTSSHTHNLLHLTSEMRNCQDQCIRQGWQETENLINTLEKNLI